MLIVITSGLSKHVKDSGLLGMFRCVAGLADADIARGGSPFEIPGCISSAVQPDIPLDQKSQFQHFQN